MKVIFCGTPEIAVPSLNALVEICDVVGVVCQPDRPSGRGMKLRPPAVKARALELELPVFQPTKMKDGSLAAWIREKDADAALVIAYGRILTLESLQAPRLGCVNLHASLLPEYRGAAPIQRVLMDGKSETGVCLMQMDEGMDTGDVLACHRLGIEQDDNAGTLAVKLGELAAKVTRTEMPRFLRGDLSSTPQDHESATHAPPIGKADQPLSFKRTAEELCHQVRGLAPRPSATTHIERENEAPRRLKVLSATLSDLPLQLGPGEVAAEQGRLVVGTRNGLLEIVTAQVEGKKPQSGRDLLNGRVLREGDRLH